MNQKTLAFALFAAFAVEALFCRAEVRPTLEAFPSWAPPPMPVPPTPEQIAAQQATNDAADALAAQQARLLTVLVQSAGYDPAFVTGTVSAAGMTNAAAIMSNYADRVANGPSAPPAVPDSSSLPAATAAGIAAGMLGYALGQYRKQSTGAGPSEQPPTSTGVDAAPTNSPSA